jgi:2-haloacid dehalogenase
MDMIDRREFVAALGAATLTSRTLLRIVGVPRRIRAVAFDGFAIFDPTPVVAIADAVVTGRGRELVTAWRARLFEYQWLRTLSGRYADFQQTASESLTPAAKSLGLTLTPPEHARLVEAQLTLVPWPDAAAAVRALHTAGLRVVLLSNMTERMLDDGARRAGIRNQFEVILSTDGVNAAKPDPRAYRMALDALGLGRDEIAFVAFAGWDAAGATWFGYPTVWMNRASAPAEELGATPAAITRDLAGVVDFVAKSR